MINSIRLVEIRDHEEFESSILAELNQGNEDSTKLFTAASSLSSSALANVVHSKPQRPGKGKAKITKFELDEANSK